MQAQKLGVRKWAVLLLIGLTGQFAWTIENMYFNVFLYNTISTDPSYIAAMVAWSAAVATVTTLLVGAWSDRVGKLRFVLPAAGVMLAGLVGMFYARGMLAVTIAGIVMMSGYILVTAALSANVRDWTPPDKAGHFQGIRMIFAVLLPMIIGPAIGSAVIRGSDSTYVELGVVKTVPTPSIFLAAAAVLLLVVIPVIILRRRERKC